MAWWFMPVSTVLKTEAEKLPSSVPAWGTEQGPISKQPQQEMRKS